MNALREFRDALARRSIIAPANIVADGAIHRCDAEGRNGKGDAAYLLHLGGIAAGGFENWRDGLGWENWRENIGRRLSPIEAAELSRRAADATTKCDADEVRRHAEARERAAAKWEVAKPADPTHPYLVTKAVKPHGIRQEGDHLVIPLRDASGELHSLQFIPPDGKEKRFLFGGRVRDCYFGIGKPDGVLCIAEGYATGASIFEATGHAVAVAFNVGNLEAVAVALRAKYPDARIVICGDDDYRTAGNPGIAAATKAARAVGGLIAIPDFGDDRPDGATDINDLAQHRGAGAVKRAIANARTPEIATHQAAAPCALVPDSDVPQVTLLRGDTIMPKPIAWLWNGYLAAGKVHIIAGAAGTGKTTLALDFAAAITIGGLWPDGTRAPVGDVLIWSGEDSPADTLVPRLRAAGADMVRVHFIGNMQKGGEPVPFDPANDFPALALAASRLPDLRLTIVDPIVSAVAGDSHHNAEVRRGLQPLVTFAECQGCALVGITHFTKFTQGREPLERVTGSLGFGAVARIVLGTAKLKDENGGGRVLVRVKSNIGPDGGGFKYELRQVELSGEAIGIKASRVEWAGPVYGTAREILATAEQEPDAEQSEREDAANWLRATLIEAGGELPMPEAIRAGERAGYKQRTLQRARVAAGVSAIVFGFGREKRSVWRLGETASMPPIMPIMPTPSLGMNGTNGGANDETGEVF